MLSALIKGLALIITSIVLAEEQRFVMSVEKTTCLDKCYKLAFIILKFYAPTFYVLNILHETSIYSDCY